MSHNYFPMTKLLNELLPLSSHVYCEDSDEPTAIDIQAMTTAAPYRRVFVGPVTRVTPATTPDVVTPPLYNIRIL